MAEPTRQLKIELGNKLEQLRIDKGIKLTDSKGLSALRDSLDEAGIKLPEGYNISSLREIFKRKQKNPNAVLALTKSKSGTGPTVRSGREEYPGQRSIATTKPEVVARRSAQTNAFINRILDLGYDEAQIEKYFFETDRDLRALINAVKRQNKKLPEGLKISFGHLNRLSESINSPRNVFLELLSENIEKGNRYSENPAAMIAIGNPSKEGVGWLENWTRDFTLWADKPENGGSGVMPQRGDFGSVIERQIHRLTGNQFDSLDEAGKIDAINQVDDLLTDIEKRNQWLPSENKQLRRWGLLSPEDYDQALAQLNDNEAKYFVKPKVDVTDVGRPLGGIRSFLTKSPSGPAKVARNVYNVWKEIPTPVKVVGAGVLGTALDLPDALAGTHGAFTSTDKEEQLQKAFQGASGWLGIAGLVNPITVGPALVAKGTELAIANRRWRDDKREERIDQMLGIGFDSSRYSHTEENPVEIKQWNRRLDAAKRLQINR